MTPSPLPAPRRVVSGLGPSGESIILFDSALTMACRAPDDPDATRSGQVWATQESPANLQTGVDEAANTAPGIVQPGQSHLSASPGKRVRSPARAVLENGELTLYCLRYDTKVDLSRASSVSAAHLCRLPPARRGRWSPACSLARLLRPPCRSADIAPGQGFPMHFTHSIGELARIRGTPVAPG